jgi:hypothetical protein
MFEGRFGTKIAENSTAVQAVCAMTAAQIVFNDTKVRIDAKTNKIKFHIL